MVDRLDVLERKVRIADIIWKEVFRVVLGIILLCLVFMGLSLIDMYRFTYQGINTCEYHDFDTLLGINPDTRAWLTVDGTNIDHPVVQAEDNFKYLDVDFYGKTYAGGSIFLDAGNAGDFSDVYSIIHGHHMEHGAMFGDLEKLLDNKFLQEYGTGQLLTPESRYALEVAGVGIFDAYNLEVYAVKGRTEIPIELLSKCSRRREVEFESGDRMLALSTCSGDMNNDRIVVLCRMRYTGKNT